MFFLFCTRTTCSSEAQRYSIWCWTDIWSLCGKMSAGRIAVEMHLLDNSSTQSSRVVADNKFIRSQIVTGIKCTSYCVWEFRDFSDQIFPLDVSAAYWKYKDRLIWSLIWHLSHRHVGALLSQRELCSRHWDSVAWLWDCLPRGRDSLKGWMSMGEVTTVLILTALSP